MSETADKKRDEQAYFLALEERLIQLNGAPRLLSPADFQLACKWQRDGLPLELVLRVIEEVMVRREEGGVGGRISSLRYFASAVETAWSKHR